MHAENDCTSPLSAAIGVSSASSAFPFCFPLSVSSVPPWWTRSPRRCSWHVVSVQWTARCRDGRRAGRLMATGEGHPIDLLLASLRADMSDSRAFMRALAARLEDALPGQVTVERRGGLLGRGKAVTRIEVELGEHRYRIAHDRQGPLTCNASGSCVVSRSVPRTFPSRSGSRIWRRTLPVRPSTAAGRASRWNASCSAGNGPAPSHGAPWRCRGRPRDSGTRESV